MADKLPWGLKSEGISPGSMKLISENKLKAFNVGSMNMKKGLNKKEQEEYKKKQQAQEAAEVYKEFVESFEDASKGINRAWVKGGTVNPPERKRDRDRGGGGGGGSSGKLYRPTSKLAELASTFKSSDSKPPREDRSDKPPVPGKKKEIKKKSNLEIFKEELIMMQKERQERRELKQAMGLDDDEGRKSRFDAPDSSGGSRGPGGVEDYRGAGYSYIDDTQTTNLYLGNINPQMSEQQLCETFGKYGPLASVKIMWPRSQEDRKRGRNCGFVAFMNRKDGERALAALQGTEIMEFEMKLGWGKAVPIPPHPFYIPPRLAELTLPPPSSGLPFNAQPSRSSRLRMTSSQDSNGSSDPPKLTPENCEEFDKTVANAVVKVVIPTERNLLSIIHRMVEFVVREGPMFEAMIMNREINNPLFRFLFENQSPAHVYYRWKLFSILQGDSVHKWRTSEYRMFKHGSYWRPPPLNPYTQGMPEELVGDKLDHSKKGQLSESQRDRLEDMLRELTPERLKVGDAMIWCLEHAESAEEIVECITESLSILQTPIPKKVARLYLISDILHNCSAKVPNASSFRRQFEPKLAEIFKDIHEAYDKIDARLRAEQFKQRVMSCFRAWEDWAVYPNDYLIKLQNIFLGLVPYKGDDDSAKEDIDGAPLDVDGMPLEDLDGAPLDGGGGGGGGGEAIKQNDADDFDGRPLDGSPFRDDLLDGLPMDSKPDVDGQPMPDEKSMTKFKYEPSKWESVDEAQLEAQAMTTSKWDLLDQGEEGQEGEEADEDIDGQPLEADAMQTSSPLQRYMMEYDSPDPRSREESPALGRDSIQREKMSELKRAKLREIELKVMKYQDEVEAGKRSRKSEMTLAEQLQYYRNKLLQKEEDKEREREREKRWEEERERVKEWERAREKERERESRGADRRDRGSERESRGDRRDRGSQRRERSSSSDGYGEPLPSFTGGLVQYGSRSPSSSPRSVRRNRSRSPVSPPAAYRDMSPPSSRRKRSRSRSPRRRRRSKSPNRMSKGGSPRRSRRSKSRSRSRSPSRHRHKHKKNKY